MTTKCHVIESGRLAPKNDDGTYPITIITEGLGSTGFYSRELLESQAHIFTNSLSFMDHPVDPAEPWKRSVKDIGGRIVGQTYAQEENGVMTVKGNYKPRAEYASFIEEYGDAIGLSIYRGATGTQREDGRIQVESFDESDPYGSVDIVVAAGRGGKFDRAAEALRAIESSLGKPEGTTRTAAPVGEKEDAVTEEQLNKLIEAIGTAFDAKFSTLVEALKPAPKGKDEEITPEKAAEAAVAAYATARDAVDQVEGLLPSQRKALLKAASTGADVAPLIESAKSLVEEAKTEFGKQNADGSRFGVVLGESATDKDDFRVAGLEL